MLLAILGCHPPLVDSDSDDESFDLLPERTTPRIESVSWSCDVDRAEWTLEARATSWTGGGRLVLTEDGAYVEQHRVRSVEAGGDGSFDRLKIVLSVAADWRAFTPNVSTAFPCAADPYALFALLDEEQERVDCRDVGPADPPWSLAMGVAPCQPVGR